MRNQSSDTTQHNNNRADALTWFSVLHPEATEKFKNLFIVEWEALSGVFRTEHRRRQQANWQAIEKNGR